MRVAVEPSSANGAAAPVKPVTADAARPTGGARPGEPVQPRSSTQGSDDARILRALLTPAAASELTEEDVVRLTRIASRVSDDGIYLPNQPGVSHQPVSPERAAELLARLDPALVQRLQGGVPFPGQSAVDRTLAGASSMATVRIIRWTMAACVAGLVFLFIAWIR
ncbi:hypothetical protein ACPVPU_08440 [Sphingomonas sp. CJ99]